MYRNNMKAFFLPVLVAAMALAAVPLQAANLVKFKGTYRGTFTASGSFTTYSGNAAGSASVRITLTQKNQDGTVRVSGIDPGSGRQYATTIKLNKNGTASANAIVPGIDLPANGTWTLSANGKKITVKLRASSPLGKASGTATLLINGSTLKVKSTGNVSIIVGSGNGRFDFTGKK
jgi:ABC-type transport system substrate-binding protein